MNSMTRKTSSTAQKPTDLFVFTRPSGSQTYVGSIFRGTTRVHLSDCIAKKKKGLDGSRDFLLIASNIISSFLIGNNFVNEPGVLDLLRSVRMHYPELRDIVFDHCSKGAARYGNMRSAILRRFAYNVLYDKQDPIQPPEKPQQPEKAATNVAPEPVVEAVKFDYDRHMTPNFFYKEVPLEIFNEDAEWSTRPVPISLLGPRSTDLPVSEEEVYLGDCARFEHHGQQHVQPIIETWVCEKDLFKPIRF